jgi:hypothetical protein
MNRVILWPTAIQIITHNYYANSGPRLGSVAGPVIQATGRSEFEDGLGSVTLCRTAHIT